MHYKYFLPFYGLSVFYLDSEKQVLFILLRIKFPNNFLRLLWLVLFCVSLKKSLPSIKSRKYSPMCLLEALSLYLSHYICDMFQIAFKYDKEVGAPLVV